MAELEETHYAVLSLQSSATRSEIRQAFRNLALECHPDKVNPTEREAATQRFQRVSEAYAILSNEEQRAAYDRTLETQSRRQKKEADEEREERERKAAWEAQFDAYERAEPVRRPSQRSYRSHGMEREHSRASQPLHRENSRTKELDRQRSQRSAGLGRQQSHRSHRSQRSERRDVYGTNRDELERMEAEAYARSPYARLLQPLPMPMPPMPPIPPMAMPPIHMARGVPPIPVTSPMARHHSQGSSRTMPPQMHPHSQPHNVSHLYTPFPDRHGPPVPPGAAPYSPGHSHGPHGPHGPHGHPHMSYSRSNGHGHDHERPWAEQRVDLPPTHPFAPSSPVRVTPSTVPYGLGPWPVREPPHFRAPLNDRRTPRSPIYAMHARAQSGSALDDLLTHLDEHVERDGGGLSRAASFARAASAARMGRGKRTSMAYSSAVRDAAPLPPSPCTPPPPRRPSADKAKRLSTGLPTPPTSDEGVVSPSRQSPPQRPGLFSTLSRTPDSSLHSRTLSTPVANRASVSESFGKVKLAAARLRPFAMSFSRRRSEVPTASPSVPAVLVAATARPAALTPVPLAVPGVPAATAAFASKPDESLAVTVSDDSVLIPQHPPTQPDPRRFDPRKGFLHHRMTRQRAAL